jgi:hypothetical protein
MARTSLRGIIALIVWGPLSWTGAARADVVLDWNAITLEQL